MAEIQAHAGNGPAPLPASAGAEDFTGKHVVPAVARLHNALASCEALMAHFAERAVDKDQFDYITRTKFALAVGRLASTQAQTAGAIARLADAETRQRLTNVKVDDAVFRPRRTIRNSGTPARSTTSDWENDESAQEKSTFNSSGNSSPAFTGPRIRQV